MKLPAEHEYAALYRTYHTPEAIQSHMTVVANLAMNIARARQAIGDVVNIPLVEAAARLHDLVRIEEQWQYLSSMIPTPLPHAEINYLLLRDNWPEVAQVIRSHSLMTIFQPDALDTLEKKLLYYADKRVNHDAVVSLQDRLNLGWERWQVTHASDRTQELLPKLQFLEDQLFSDLTIQPSDLHVSE